MHKKEFQPFLRTLILASSGLILTIWGLTNLILGAIRGQPMVFMLYHAFAATFAAFLFLLGLSLVCDFIINK